jgi:hypothetical protein
VLHHPGRDQGAGIRPIAPHCRSPTCRHLPRSAPTCLLLRRWIHPLRTAKRQMPCASTGSERAHTPRRAKSGAGAPRQSSGRSREGSGQPHIAESQDVCVNWPETSIMAIPKVAADICPATPVTRCYGSCGVLRAAPLQDVECDVVVLGSGLEVRTDVVAGHGDGAAEGPGGGERLCHRGGEWATFVSVAVLEQCHGP